MNPHNTKEKVLVNSVRQVSFLHNPYLTIVDQLRLHSNASTVTQGTHRSLRQLIHVESSTVTDPDVILPVTTFTDPVITNLSANHTLGLCGMFTVEPTRGMGTTSPCWYAGVWHDFTGGGREAVPLGGQISVTPDHLSVFITRFTVGVVDEGVRTAFWGRTVTYNS